MFQLTIVDNRDYSVFLQEMYATGDESQQAAVAWFCGLVGNVTAEGILDADDDDYNQMVRYCDGPDRIQFHIEEVSHDET